MKQTSKRSFLMFGALALLAGGSACAVGGKDAPAAPASAARSAAPSSAPAVVASLVPSAPPTRPDDLPAPPDVTAPPADAEKAPSGLASKVITPGQGGDKPKAWDVVKVHYAGWTTDGRMFDGSHRHGGPATFPLNRVIPGWTEGVQLMAVGEKRRFWIPEEMAYKGRPGPQGILVFDVELLEIQKGKEPAPPPTTPADVAAPPKDAEKSPKGVFSKVLVKGKGKAKPAPTSRVRVHYSGWTTDGKLFDSSVTDGEPVTFGLNQVIPGWTEGVGLMVEGEKRRLWIPEELAYKGKPGRPQGMLVFDVELLAIETP
jgi:peptidylprolyl isomerase